MTNPGVALPCQRQITRNLLPVNSRRDHILVATIASFPLVVWWLGWFPGFLSFDSVDQLGQAASGQIFDFHPAAHTIVLRWIGLGSAAPGLVTFLQGSALVAVLVLVARRLSALGVPRWAAMGAAAGVPWLPAVAQTTLTVWKDVPFTLLLVLLFAELLAVARHGVSHLNRHPVRIGLILGGIWLFRHNGLLTVIGLLVALALVYRSSIPWAKLIGTGAALVLLVTGPLYALYNVDRTRPATSEVLIGDVATAYLNTGIFEEDDVQYLSAIAIRQDWVALYDCDDSNPILFDGRFNKGFIRQDGGRFLARGLEAWGQALPTVAGHRFCAASYLYLPAQPDDAYLHRPPFAIPENTLGIARDPMLGAAYDLTLRVFQFAEPPERLWLTWRPALVLFAGTLAGIFVWFRRPRIWRWPSALMAIHLLNVFMTSLNQEFRFAFPLYLMALLSLPLVLAPDPA